MVKKALIVMVAAEILSLLAFKFPVLQLPFLIISGIAALVISFHNLEWGIYILFGELFFGSRGHLLEYNFGFITLSLRLVIFSSVFAAWLIKAIKSRKSKVESQSQKFNILYGVLLAVIGFGIVNGLLRHNGLGNVFNDANAYLYLLIAPAVLSVIKSRKQVENLLDILAAAIVVIAAKTLILFFWFTFALPGVATAYHWIISQDFGEITGDVGKASRVFMQSQFFALMGLFIFALREKKNWVVISAAILSIIMSLSRSFWLGLIAGGIFAFIMLLGYYRVNFKSVMTLGFKIALIAALEIGILLGIGSLGGGFADAVSSRGGNPATEAAGGARPLLLPELWKEVKEFPILGAGFGETVTYKSFLPDRITPKNPDGEITSYAFEWGYLDVALKAGILGLIIYLFFIVVIFERGWGNFQTLGFLSALVALLALNITTPYLNHPLGIGYLILAAAAFKTDG